jgi:hypothetical protein
MEILKGAYMRIINLHIGLFKYLRTELKRKRTPNQLIKFLLDLGKNYLLTILNEYKMLFHYLDPQYQKARQDYKLQQQYRKDITNAWKILQWMMKKGNNRYERKQIKRDFIKYGKMTKELQDAILRDVYGERG